MHGLEESAELSTRFAAIPVTEVTVEDVWFTSGMRATGSNAVVVDDVFVPSARTCGGRDLFDGTVAPDDDPLGALPLVSVLALTASAPAVGAAEAGAALHRQRISERVLAYSLGERAVDQPVAQSRLAAVMSAVATTRAGWDAAIAGLETAARAAPPDDLLRASTRLAAAAACARAGRSSARSAKGRGPPSTPATIRSRGSSATSRRSRATSCSTGTGPPSSPAGSPSATSCDSRTWRDRSRQEANGGCWPGRTSCARAGSRR